MSAAEWPALIKGEELLEDSSELLWRQVNPAFVHDGNITSQAFRVTPKDEGRLSTSRSSIESAKDAYDFYTEALRCGSAGSWGVTVGEVQDAKSRAIFDARSEPAPPAPCPPGHTSIDCRIYGGSAIKRVGAELAIKAGERGRQYPYKQEPPVNLDTRRP